MADEAFEALLLVGGKFGFDPVPELTDLLLETGCHRIPQGLDPRGRIVHEGFDSLALFRRQIELGANPAEGFKTLEARRF